MDLTFPHPVRRLCLVAEERLLVRHTHGSRQNNAHIQILPLTRRLASISVLMKPEGGFPETWLSAPPWHIALLLLPVQGPHPTAHCSLSSTSVTFSFL